MFPNFSELKSEIAKLRDAHQSPTVNLEEYRSTVREVAQLKERLSDAENAKSEANAKWLKKLEESERRKAEEIGELKVRCLYNDLKYYDLYKSCMKNKPCPILNSAIPSI